MALTNIEVKYIKIVSWQLANNANNLLTANHFSCGHRTIDRARNFAKKCGLFNTDSAIVVLEEITKLSKKLSELEKINKKLLRRIHTALDTNGNKCGPVYQYVALQKSIFDYTTRISELRGIYKKTLRLELEQSGENKEVDLSNLSDESLLLFKQLLEEAKGEYTDITKNPDD